LQKWAIWPLLWFEDHSEKAAFSGEIDLFGDAEFIAPDVLFKTTNAVALK